MVESSIELIYFLSVLGGLVGGCITIFLKSWLETQKEIILIERQKKIGAYEELLGTIKGFYKINNPKIGETDKELFIQQYTKALVYLSDRVVFAINNFLETIKVKENPASDAERLSSFRKVVLAIRKDINPNTKLKEEDINTWIAVKLEK